MKILMATETELSNVDHTVFKNETPKDMIKSVLAPYMGLSCDVCKSSDIFETKEGYVCRTCGIVLEIQKLEYHKPYNNDILQYAKLGTTQIGSIRERFQNLKSIQLEKLNKLQSIKSNKEAVLEQAKIEISRIFTCLNLPQSLKDLVYHKFIKIRSAIRPGTKYRAPEKLVPLTIYFVCKFENISINEAELLEVSKISKKDFYAFKLQILNFFPEYVERDRKTYILQKILEITEHFKLGMEFYFQSKKILFRLWDSIRNTKDEVIAGLVASISVLCAFKSKDVSVSAICNKLGIKMSTIQSQVKRRIFDEFKISGFTTLIKSTDLLKNVMEKMGLIEVKHIPMEKENCPNIIELELGNIKQESNCLNNADYYFYSLRNNNGLPHYFSLKCFNNSIGFDNQKVVNSSNGYDIIEKEDKLFELKIVKFLTTKNPPNFEYISL